ncbi:MAG: thiamine diphosphokinase [Lachnospiraceae bacterium]|nr:thiamine diphosphokinase [Lachnospiraceae bacterium]
MKKALIICGGEFSPISEDLKYDYVIACDSGANYAVKMGIIPDLIVGDFDSYEGDIYKDFPCVTIETHPVMKDDTDAMLAIKKALSMGYEHIILSCALGMRLDHTLSNIESLHYISAHGCIGEIVSENEHLRTLNSIEAQLSLHKREGCSLSLYALSDYVKGLSIEGAKYPLDKATITNSFPLCHGNSFVEDTVTISLEEGFLLIVESLKN